MPELPEVETVRRTLKNFVLERKITSVDIIYPKIIEDDPEKFIKAVSDQKINDIKEYHIDTFVIGDDWKGKFDYLKDEGVEVIYLPRTPEISTTQIKEDLHHTEEK